MPFNFPPLLPGDVCYPPVQETEIPLRIWGNGRGRQIEEAAAKLQGMSPELFVEMAVFMVLELLNERSRPIFTAQTIENAEQVFCDYWAFNKE